MKIIAYHGGKLDEITNGRLFFSTEINVAKGYSGLTIDGIYRNVYKCELTLDNPLIFKTSEEYDDFIQSFESWEEVLEKGYDSIICEEEPNYIVALDPVKQVKILEIVSDKNMNEENYVYAHLEKNDYDEFEVFTDEVEVMIFSPNDNVQRLRQFLNDKGTLRCIIDKNIYLWDAHEATHGAMHDYLKNKFNCKYNYGNAFMFNSKHIDPTSLNDVLFHIEDGKEFLDNYKMLKELLGIDYDKYALTDLEKLKNKISLTEKFEEIADDMFATNSAYDIINQMKNKPKPIRLVYDKNINYYFIGDAYLYIHQDILEEAFYQGFYPDMLSSSEARDKVDNYEVLLFAFYPSENHRQDLEKSSDGYTRKYVYDFGTIYSHEMTPLEDFEIYNILGEPKKKETILENIYSKLNEELNNFF